MKFKLKLPKRKKVFKKEKDTLNSDLYWNIALYSAFLIIFAGFVMGYFSFKKINKESFSVGAQSQNSKIEKEKELQQALEFFADRAEKSNEILNSPSVFVDPSI